MSVSVTGSGEAVLSSDWLSGLLVISQLPVRNVFTERLLRASGLRGPAAADRSFMAKRRAEEAPPHDPPPKRCYRSACGVSMQLARVAPTGGPRPPALLALLGSRSRKRPHCWGDPEEQEAVPHRRPSPCVQQAPGGAPSRVPGDRLSSSRASTSRTTRSGKDGQDGTSSESVVPTDAEQADEDTNAEYCAYNAFQYWRPPLPELDLSLLGDSNERSQTDTETKVKDSSSDAMET